MNKQDLKATEERALNDSAGAIDDVDEAVKFVIETVKKKSFAESALKLDGYIAQAVNINLMTELWNNTVKRELLGIVGEDNEDMVKMLPIFLLARALQNFDKRRDTKDKF